MIKIRHQGFVALTAVLILSAIFLSLSVTIMTRALAGGDQILSVYAHTQARIVSESCAEYALLQIQQTLDYAGNESILVGDETCDILLVREAGNNSRIIQAQSTVSEHVYRAEVVIGEISPEIVISSWNAVENF